MDISFIDYSKSVEFNFSLNKSVYAVYNLGKRSLTVMIFTSFIMNFLRPVNGDTD